MSELLIEIRSGEIPAPMQEPARLQLKDLLECLLKETHLNFKEIRTYVGPRRLVAVVESLDPMQQDRVDEKRGPRVDAPDTALQGFLKSTGASLEELEKRESDKGTFYFFTQHLKGTETRSLLPDLLDKLLIDFKWPKSMTWATTKRSWIRPISGGICLYDGTVVPVSINFSAQDDANPVVVEFNDLTVGHRYLAPSPFRIKDFEDYTRKLKQAFVIVDQDERRALIEKQLSDLETEYKFNVVRDEALLEEVCGLVEWPCALLGSIDPAFANLPDEVLQTSMRVHQRYFCVSDTSGKLLPHFIVIANQNPKDSGIEIRTGNERVLRARLSDAAFFIQQDQKMSLKERAQGLTKILFHQDLGTMLDKQTRVQKLIENLLPKDNVQHHALQAAEIFKADLISELVFEFTELQGIVGAFYAGKEGYAPEVCQAIYDQYTPKGTSDPLPTQRESQYIGFCDRLDTLVGFFAIGLKPTGSKDPFALRRSALGFLRFLEAGLELPLSEALSKSYDLYEQSGHTKIQKTTCLEETQNFLRDRLRVFWRDQGFDLSHIDAVLSLEKTENLSALRARLEALATFFDTQQEGATAVNLLQGYKRAHNILHSHKTQIFKEPQQALFEDTTEQHLYEGLLQERLLIEGFLQQQDYRACMTHLANLRPKIDAFFEAVLVQDERPEIQENRLALLKQVTSTIEQVADFSKIS